MAETPAKAGSVGRLVAILVIVAGLAALGYIHRDDLFPREQEAAAALNPEFVKCRDERVGHVEKMLADGVIDETRHAQFKERAISFCAAQFPPGGDAAPQ